MNLEKIRGKYFPVVDVLFHLELISKQPAIFPQKKEFSMKCKTADTLSVLLVQLANTQFTNTNNQNTACTVPAENLNLLSS